MREVEKPLVNRIANSGLIVLKLDEYFPKGEIISFDLKDYLFREMILKEKDFRTALKNHDWQQYKGKNLAVFCSTDAIIPMWAYMLVMTYAQPVANMVLNCSPEDFHAQAFLKIISKIDAEKYQGERVIIKGCGEKPVPSNAYAELTAQLLPYARTIMFGEPCSTVPVYKKPRK